MRPPRPALAASSTTSTPNGSVDVVRPSILLADDDEAALDITELRRIENAVRESEELFRNMADHVP